MQKHMIKVSRYITADGIAHEDEEDAQKHIITTIENAIGPIVDAATVLHPRDRLKIVDALCGTIERAEKLHAILSAMLDK